MTKKHYIKLAELIKDHKIQDHKFTSDLMKFMKDDNPRFNEKTFKGAIQ
tara:strand:+ start:386 stop:532 length:147 start_codon:yes stop_codon:yes gene_type:complete